MSKNKLLASLNSIEKSDLITYAEKYNKKVAERRIQYRASNRTSEKFVAQARLTS